MRDALLTGRATGAGPDVLTTMWANWWFSQEWSGAAWGGASRLANWPHGVKGAVLSPMTATLWSLLAPLTGPAFATTLTALVYLTAMTLAVVQLAGEAGARHRWVAGLAFLAQRYCLYAIGETSLVGITALPVVLGLTALLRHRRTGSVPSALVLLGCTGLAGMDAPYVAALLVVAPLALAPRHPRLLPVAMVGALVLAGAAMVVGRGQIGEFGMVANARSVGFGTWRTPVVEMPWARSAWRDLVLPGEVVWSFAPIDSMRAAGRDYLGLAVVLLVAVALFRDRRRALPWAALGVAGVVVATGSDWFGYPAPFALINEVASRVVRAFTQPTRFLVLPAIGFAVAAALGADRLGRARLPALALLVLDAFCFGGLSLRLPTMEVPLPDCLVALRKEPRAAVLTWPWEGSRAPVATINTRFLQLAHEQPTASFGVGSWQMLGPFPTALALEELGLADAVEGRGLPRLGELPALGFGWVVSDTGAGAQSVARARDVFGKPSASCPGYEVFTLAGVRPPDPDHPVWKATRSERQQAP
jgi:hypothetical protein